MSDFIRESATSELNDLAVLITTGETVPGHTPSDPRYWFFGLARELGDDILARLDLSNAAREILVNGDQRGRWLLPPVDAPHSGCLNCGPKPQTLAMDYVLGVGFGGVMATCDDECVWQGDSDTITVQRFEDEAAKKGGILDHNWLIRIDAPLWNATYQRQATEHWVCVEKGMGFA